LSSLVACPGCQHKLMLPADFAGQRVQCPQCFLEFAPVAAVMPAMEVEPQLPCVDAKPANGNAEAANKEPRPPTQTAYAPAGRAPARSAPASARESIFCILCGTKFSRAEEACPNCGHLSPALPEERPRERRRPLPRILMPPRGELPILAAVLFPLGLVILIAAEIAADIIRRGPPGFGIPFVLFISGTLIEVTALACSVVWLYQAWRMVMRGDEDCSPGLMVGLLFVPFFNLYWMFRAIPGLSMAIQDELRYLAPARTHSAGQVPGVIACIFVLIPYGQPVGFCIYLAWMLIANNALHRLARFHDEAHDDSDERADSMEQ
jgi:hypothetical protein